MPARTPRAARRALTALTSVGALAALGLAATAAAPGVLHVQRGDTLSQLAAKYGTTVAALRSANGLTSDLILAGQDLRLPSSGGVTATAEQAHVVAQGETVTSIAARYGTTVPAVQARNGLAASAVLRPGQTLVVPTTAPAPATAAAPAGPASAAAAHDRAVLAARAVPSRDTVRALVASTARRYGVDVSLAVAIAYQESGFQQRVVSGVDAVGAMQVLPSTARTLSAQIGRPLDLLDASDNVLAGVLVLRQLLRSTPSVDAAIAGYYQGLGSIAVQGVLPQTVQYIANVHALQPRFAKG